MAALAYCKRSSRFADVIAIALDDDQGAYLDNDTWPAPNLQAYLAWLRGVVHGVTGFARAGFHQHLSDEGTGGVARMGLGKLVPRRRAAIG